MSERANQRISELIDRLRDRMREDPGSASFHRLANLYTRIGRFEDALRVCHQGLKHNPTALEGHIALGRACLGMNALEDAAETLQVALRLAPWEAEAYRLMGEVLIQQQRLSEAVSWLEGCVNSGMRHRLVIALLERARTLRANADQTEVDQERRLWKTRSGEGGDPADRKADEELLSADFVDWSSLGREWDQQIASRPASVPPTSETEMSRPLDPEGLGLPAPGRAEGAANEGLRWVGESERDEAGARRRGDTEEIRTLETPSYTPPPEAFAGADGFADDDAVSYFDEAVSVQMEGKEVITRALKRRPLASGPPHSPPRQGAPHSRAPNQGERRAPALKESAPMAAFGEDFGVMPTRPAGSAMRRLVARSGAEEEGDAEAAQIPAPAHATRPITADEVVVADGWQEGTEADLRAMPEIDAPPEPLTPVAGAGRQEARAASAVAATDDALLEQLLPGLAREESVSAVDLLPAGPSDSAIFPPPPDGPRGRSQRMTLMTDFPDERRPRVTWIIVLLVLAFGGGVGAYLLWRWHRQGAMIDAQQEGAIEARYRAGHGLLGQAASGLTATAEALNHPTFLEEAALLRAIDWLAYRTGTRPSVPSSEHKTWAGAAAHAAIALSEGRWQEARELLEAAPAASRDRALSSALLAWAAWTGGERSEARALAVRAIRAEPRLVLGHWLLGTLEREEGQYDAAQKAFRRALAYGPKSELARTGLASALAHGGAGWAAVEQTLARKMRTRVGKSWQLLLGSEQLPPEKRAKQLEELATSAPESPALLFAVVEGLLDRCQGEALGQAWERLQEVRAAADPVTAHLGARVALARGLGAEVFAYVQARTKVSLEDANTAAALLWAAELAPTEFSVVQAAMPSEGTADQDTAEATAPKLSRWQEVAELATEASTAAGASALTTLRKRGRAQPALRVLVPAVLLARGDLEDTERAARAAKGGDRPALFAGTLAGLAQLHSGKYKAAIATFSGLQERCSGFLPAREGLGAAYLEVGRSAESIEVLEEVLAEDPRRPLALAHLAAALAWEGRVEEATSRLAALEALGASKAQLERARGFVALAKGNAERAATLLAAAGRSPLDRIALIRALDAQGKHERSADERLKAKEAWPQNPLLLVELAERAVAADDPVAPAELQQALQALKSKPAYAANLVARTHIGLAIFYGRDPNTSDRMRDRLVAQHLRAAVKANPRSPKAHQLLGEFHLAAGNLSAARRVLEKSARLKPGVPETEAALKRLETAEAKQDGG